MADYRHHVSGFFVKRDEAQIALDKLVIQGLPAEQLHIYDNHSNNIQPAANANSNALLKNMVLDGAMGAAVGTGVGLLAEVSLLVANVSLFVASPLIAPLVLMGWEASLGGVIGTVAGNESTKNKPGRMADLVQDAIMDGQVVLVVKTRSDIETDLAKEVLQRAVGDFKDRPSA